MEQGSKARFGAPLAAVVLQLMLLLANVQHSQCQATKWTVLVYLLADNDLECFGLNNMLQMMMGMSQEPAGACTTATCGAACPDGYSQTYSTACGSNGNSQQARCCPKAAYPDVYVLVDRGLSSCLVGLDMPSEASSNYPHLDQSLLTAKWSNPKELVLLPGGRWQLLRDYPEMSMSSPDTLSGFLQRALLRYPPEASRKYQLVFWDHGAGWQGFGADSTCSPLGTYNPNGICDIFTMPALLQGIKAGLTSSTGVVQKMDIIGFDACLMSMYEVAAMMQPYTRYFLASQLLEPGAGWDYIYLSSIVASSNSASALDVGQAVIDAYMAQSYFEGSTGITMAMTDLDTFSAVQTGVVSVADTLKAALAGSNAASYAVSLLQQRARLSRIIGAEASVDLGALLNRMTLVRPADTTFQAAVSSASAAYKGLVKQFKRDSQLADGTGVAIYFPATDADMDASYPNFVTYVTPALSSWLAFLQSLYTTTAAIQSGGALKFVERSAVPYYSQTSQTWVTHGTLNSQLGVSASLLYGFVTPAGSSFVLAGSTVGTVSGTLASGSWSGFMFGLVQDLVSGDGHVDHMALVETHETHSYDSNGNLASMTFQMPGKFGSTCSTPLATMSNSMITYTLDVVSGNTTMQLFVQSSTGVSSAWAEVAQQQGGVFVPYLSKVQTTSRGVLLGASYGYSDCFKWGYADTIDLAAFDIQEAADVLHISLAEDMVTFLTVTSLDGNATQLFGSIKPSQKTLAGCQCAQSWPYTWSNGTTTQQKGTCINPASDAQGAWCMYEPGSCTNAPAAFNATHDYCPRAKTLSGCSCAATYTLVNGHTHYGTCQNEDNDPLGSWCFVDNTTCPGAHRAHKESAAKDNTWDYCQTQTYNGCSCLNTWAFNGTSYSGTCATGLPAGRKHHSIKPNTNWCFVDANTCSGADQLDGYAYDVCTAPSSRLAVNGLPCQFPATYNGIKLYDCITYNHTAPAVASEPWCFTNTNTGAWAFCAPETCSKGIKSNCPSAALSTTNMAAWSAPACLEAVCIGRGKPSTAAGCPNDTLTDLALLQQSYSSLNGSAAFSQLLSQTYSASTLDSYCTTQYGRLCMQDVILPSCPALFSDATGSLYINSKASKVCSLDCLRAMCRLKQSEATQPCRDAATTGLVTWYLQDIMDSSCGYDIPVDVMCSQLLSGPQLCSAKTTLDQLSGTITDGTLTGGNYSANSRCVWTISLPESPYISLAFSRFNTELSYDTVTVEDMDGVLGQFSGSALPANLTTDTGLVRITFSSDTSIQSSGFALSYTASSSAAALLPKCAAGEQLLQATVRTRKFASEMSWVVVDKSSLPVQQQTVRMTGGRLPSATHYAISTTVKAAATFDYKDLRSYSGYSCVPSGNYTLRMYDAYGDGWNGGRVTLALMSNNSAGDLTSCTVASGSVTAFTANEEFAVEQSSYAQQCLTAADAGATHYVEAQLLLVNETTATVTLARQRRLKEALAVLLDVDTSLINITGLEARSGASGGAFAPTAASRAVAGAVTQVQLVEGEQEGQVLPARSLLSLASGSSSGDRGGSIGSSSISGGISSSGISSRPVSATAQLQEEAREMQAAARQRMPGDSDHADTQATTSGQGFGTGALAGLLPSATPIRDMVSALQPQKRPEGRQLIVSLDENGDWLSNEDEKGAELLSHGLLAHALTPGDVVHEQLRYQQLLQQQLQQQWHADPTHHPTAGASEPVRVLGTKTAPKKASPTKRFQGAADMPTITADEDMVLLAHGHGAVMQAHGDDDGSTVLVIPARRGLAEQQADDLAAPEDTDAEDNADSDTSTLSANDSSRGSSASGRADALFAKASSNGGADLAKQLQRLQRQARMRQSRQGGSGSTDGEGAEPLAAVLQLMGPKTPPKRHQQQQGSKNALLHVKRRAGAAHGAGAAGRVAVMGVKAHGGVKEVHRRRLAADATSTPGVIVSLRISGYSSNSQANAAASSLQDAVNNGSLAATLQAQGWANAQIMLLSVSTGNSNPISTRMAIILAVVLSAVVGTLIVTTVLVIRAIRRRRSAMLPSYPAYPPGGLPPIMGGQGAGPLYPGSASPVPPGSPRPYLGYPQPVAQGHYGYNQVPPRSYSPVPLLGNQDLNPGSPRSPASTSPYPGQHQNGGYYYQQASAPPALGTPANVFYGSNTAAQGPISGSPVHQQYASYASSSGAPWGGAASGPAVHGARPPSGSGGVVPDIAGPSEPDLSVAAPARLRAGSFKARQQGYENLP